MIGLIKCRNMMNSSVTDYPLLKNLTVAKLKVNILVDLGKKRRLSIIHNGKDLEDNVILEKLLTSDKDTLNVMVVFASQLSSICRFKDNGKEF